MLLLLSALAWPVGSEVDGAQSTQTSSELLWLVSVILLVILESLLDCSDLIVLGCQHLLAICFVMHTIQHCGGWAADIDKSFRIFSNLSQNVDGLSFWPLNSPLKDPKGIHLHLSTPPSPLQLPPSSPNPSRLNPHNVRLPKSLHS